MKVYINQDAAWLAELSSKAEDLTGLSADLLEHCELTPATKARLAAIADRLESIDNKLLALQKGGSEYDRGYIAGSLHAAGERSNFPAEATREVQGLVSPDLLKALEAQGKFKRIPKGVSGLDPETGKAKPKVKPDARLATLNLKIDLSTLGVKK